MRKIITAALLALWSTLAFGQAPPAVPALPDTSRLTTYTLSASTCGCPVNFALFGDGVDQDNWIQVFVGTSPVLSTDPTFGWSLSSPTGSLGTIPRPITDAVLTFNAAQSATVTIVGARRPRRLSQFSENRGIPARDHNQALTDIVAQHREAWDKLNGALVGQPGESLLRLPPAATRANQVLAFNAQGNPTVVAVPSSIPTGQVTGPGSSTVGDLATWGNTLGTALVDTPVLGVPHGGTGAAANTAHGVLIAEGTSAHATANPSSAGQILIDQGAVADPAFKPVSGDATIAGSGAATINPGVVSNSKLANMAAGAIKCRPFGSGTGSPQDCVYSIVHAADFVASGAANAQNTTVNVTITGGTAALAVGTATFVSTDCQTGTGCTGSQGNKVITIGGIGAAGAPLQTTIIGFTDSQHITLGNNASTGITATSEPIVWGTDNTTALQNWWNQCAGNGVCWLDSGRYLITSALTTSSQIVMKGDGRFQAEITQANPTANSLSVNTTNAGMTHFYEFQLSKYIASSSFPALMLLTGSGSAQFGSTLVDLYLSGTGTAISAQNVQYLNIDRVISLNSTDQAVFYNYPLACNTGAIKVENSFFAPATTAGSAFNIQAAGGFSLINSGVTPGNGFQLGSGIGVNIAPSTACQFGNIFIDNTSLENWTTGFKLAKGSATAGGAIHIIGTDFAGNVAAVQMGDGNAGFVNDITLSGDHFYCSTTCVTITNSATNVSVTGNTFDWIGSGTPTGLSIGSTVTGTAQSNTFVNMTTNVSNSSPKFLAESIVNGHSTWVGVAPTLTAGCNGAGSSVSGTDRSGTVTGQTAAATQCTLTFAQSYAAAPNCVASGLNSPLTGALTPGTSTLVVNFASTATYKWTYFCPGN